MSSQKNTKQKKFTVRSWALKKKKNIPISMVTAYDYSSAKYVDEAGIDTILVGDSMNMVMLGEDSTYSLTMDQTIHHCKAVKAGSSRAFIVGDLPFMSYQADIVEAVKNAGRLLKEGKVDGVKLEGGKRMAAQVRAIVNAGIPVVGHIGLTPQSLSQLGGYRIQGKTSADALALYDDALALQEAGCIAIVLESVPVTVATEITERLDIPTIGIGAGAGCDGQVLVYHDLLGIFDDFTPRFVRRYANLKPLILEALESFHTDVEARAFPGEEHVYLMKDDEKTKFLSEINQHDVF